jgi:pimeloyl-ACP methyl ester carboxylesterase
MGRASCRAVGAVREETVEVAGWHEDPWPVHVRRADPPAGAGAGAPVLYLHGVPTSGEDWAPFLARTGGIAPDLPGFGRSSKRGDGDFTLDGLGRFPGPLLDALGVDRVRLVVHDWGAAALAWAAAHPERVERLVVLDAVPLLPGYRWHRVARLWRTRLLGEMAVGAAVGPILRRALPGDLGRQAAAHFDQGTQRAILRLYRSADPDRLAAAGAGLGALAGVPALVVWGEDDPYIAPSFAHAYADALGGATVDVRPGLGHWPWVQDAAVVDAVARALA